MRVEVGLKRRPMVQISRAFRNVKILRFGRETKRGGVDCFEAQTGIQAADIYQPIIQFPIVGNQLRSAAEGSGTTEEDKSSLPIVFNGGQIVLFTSADDLIPQLSACIIQLHKP